MTALPFIIANSSDCYTLMLTYPVTVVMVMKVNTQILYERTYNGPFSINWS